MTDSSTWQRELYDGLQAIADSSFPKHCKTCGRVYENAEEYIRDTVELKHENSGLKQSYDDVDAPIVELYRNCKCGSTLLDFFSDRRDVSEAGLRRRKKFDELHAFLIQSGMDSDLARAVLLKVLRSGKSTVLSQYSPPV